MSPSEKQDIIDALHVVERKLRGVGEALVREATDATTMRSISLAMELGARCAVVQVHIERLRGRIDAELSVAEEAK